MATLTSWFLSLPTALRPGNGDDDELGEAVPAFDALPPLTDEDEAVIDRAWIPLLSPGESDLDDGAKEGDFMPAVAAVGESDEDSEPLASVPEDDFVLPPGEDDEDNDQPLEHTLIAIEPILDDDDGNEDSRFDAVGLSTAVELPELSTFTVDWRDAEAARQLLRIGTGFVAVGRECRHHNADGELLTRYGAPPGLMRAAVMRRTTWLRSLSKLTPIDAGPEILCVSGGKVLLRSGDDWVELLDEELRTEFEAHDIVQRSDDVLVCDRDGRWFLLEDGALLPAFGGRRLRALGASTPWVGLGEESQGAVVMALEGESARPLFVSPVSAARLHGLSKTLVVDSPGDGLWLSALPAARPEFIAGSAAFRGVCLGEVSSRQKLWTTLEHGDALALVEIDVESSHRAIVATLPWLVNDDDVPTVYDMLWLAEANRLIVASDHGLVALGRTKHDADQPMLPSA